MVNIENLNFLPYMSSKLTMSIVLLVYLKHCLASDLGLHCSGLYFSILWVNTVTSNRTRFR